VRLCKSYKSRRHFGGLYSLTLKVMVEHHPTPERKLKERIMKRDNKKCCLTGQRSQLFEKLRVVPVLPIDDFNLKKVEKSKISPWIIVNPKQGSLLDMLIAFVGPDQANKLLSWNKTDLESKCRNHWLLGREAADVYAQGSIRLEKLEDALVSSLCSFHDVEIFR